jgi:hypothetical protein
MLPSLHDDFLVSYEVNCEARQIRPCARRDPRGRPAHERQMTRVIIFTGVAPCPLDKMRRKIAPSGKSPKICPAPLVKIFRLTRRANRLYKLAPSHPRRGGSRVVTNARWDAMDATASGAQSDRRAGPSVSDRPARGRTALLTVFARTSRAARGSARPLALMVADGEVVWS